jgi:sugar phosphate isomerase/epimerase
MPDLKKTFRLGTTSYIYPDDILPNVQKLAGQVDDIELVLFEVDGYGTNLPSPNVATELRTIANANALTYTVHLPLDLLFGDAASFDQARRAIDATHMLDPLAYVMHLDGRALIGNPLPHVIAQWQDDAGRALEQIIAFVGEAKRVCVENVERWDSAHFVDLVARVGAGRCIDVGHLWLGGQNPIPYLQAHLHCARVIHLHGIGERDHQALTCQPRPQVFAVLDCLARENFAGVVTLEVFSTDDFFASKNLVDEWATDSR